MRNNDVNGANCDYYQQVLLSRSIICSLFSQPSKNHDMRKARTDAARNFYVAVGKRIADARVLKRLTQDALARDIGLTRTSIVNIEKGRQQLLFHTLVQIAHVLKVEPVDLIPNIVPVEFPVSDAISHFVEDPGGRAWIETSLSRKYGAS